MHRTGATILRTPWHAPTRTTGAVITAEHHEGLCFLYSVPNLEVNLSACEQVLVELAIEREQDIPALIYEGRSRAVGANFCLLGRCAFSPACSD